MVKFTPALTLIICLATVGGLRAQDMTKPIGRWERKLGKNHVMLIVEDHRLHVSYTGENVVTLHADYATTRDGVIYGVVTSIEGDEDEETEAAKTLFDAPFSFRFRIDEGALIIHDAKSSDAASKEDLWNGRFKAVRQATTHNAAAPPSSYLNYFTPNYFTPLTAPKNSPPPPTPIGSSFSTPTDAQIFNFWSGFIR